MTQTDGFLQARVQLPRQLVTMADQGITVQVVPAFLLAAVQKLGRRFVLIVARVAVDGERNEVRTCLVQLSRELILRFKQGKPAAGLNAGIGAAIGVRYARKAFGRNFGEMLAHLLRRDALCQRTCQDLSTVTVNVRKSGCCAGKRHALGPPVDG